MMGACLGNGVASEESDDNTVDGGSFIGDCEGEWYLDVARQVASTTHTRSTVKARWTISHFADGGFDLDADPYEVGHTHELDLFPARSTFYLCDWPRGKRNDAARHFLRLY